MKKIRQLLLMIPHRVKVFFFSWVLVNLSLFFISAFLTKWSFRVNSSEVHLINPICNNNNVIEFGEKTSSNFLVVYCFSSSKVLFPFPKEFISQRMIDCFGHIGAFRIESYDWTELIIYTLIPLLIILFSAWLRIREEKQSSQ